FPAGTMKLMFTPVFFVTYWEVGSTPHLFGNQAKFRYQSKVMGDVSDFHPGSSADGVAAGSALSCVPVLLLVFAAALLALSLLLLPLPPQAARDRTMMAAISSIITFLDLLFMPMLFYPFSRLM